MDRAPPAKRGKRNIVLVLPGVPGPDNPRVTDSRRLIQVRRNHKRIVISKEKQLESFVLPMTPPPSEPKHNRLVSLGGHDEKRGQNRNSLAVNSDGRLM